jgi:hypothetical protein
MNGKMIAVKEESWRLREDAAHPRYLELMDAVGLLVEDYQSDFEVAGRENGPTPLSLPVEGVTYRGLLKLRSPVWLLSEKLFWYVASIVCELLEDGLMQPHVHLGRIAHLLFGTSEFGRKLFSRIETAIQVEQLEQIHN